MIRYEIINQSEEMYIIYVFNNKNDDDFKIIFLF